MVVVKKHIKIFERPSNGIIIPDGLSLVEKL